MLTTKLCCAPADENMGVLRVLSTATTPAEVDAILEPVLRF